MTRSTALESDLRASPALATVGGSRSKPVQASRIVHEDLLSDQRIGCPYRQLIQQTAVVDLMERRDVGWLAAWRRDRIRMRPVRAPDDAIGVRSDERPRQRHDVRIVWSNPGTAIRPGDLDVSLSRPHEFQQFSEARLSQPERCLGAAEMIEHDRDGGAGNDILDRGDHGEVRVDLNVPADRKSTR